jgi:arsenate reductase (thioredoxin)
MEHQAVANEPTSNLLIVGTGNVARSIMAEAYINALPRRHWHAASAGAKPAGKVSALAATVLAEFDLRPELRCKSWQEFAGPAAPVMDVVITICDKTASETSPLWPGTPRLLHWPIPDPAAAAGTIEDRMATYRAVFELIRNNVDAFLAEERASAHT